MYWIIKQISHHLYWRLYFAQDMIYIYFSISRWWMRFGWWWISKNILILQHYYISYHYLLNKYISIYCNNRYNSPLLNWWLTDEKRENENFWIPPLFWGNDAVAGRRCHLSHVRLVRAPVESPDKILCWELLLPRYKGWTCDYPDNREDVGIISWYSNSANFQPFKLPLSPLEKLPVADLFQRIK